MSIEVGSAEGMRLSIVIAIFSMPLHVPATPLPTPHLTEALVALVGPANTRHAKGGPERPQETLAQT